MAVWRVSATHTHTHLSESHTQHDQDAGAGPEGDPPQVVFQQVPVSRLKSSQHRLHLFAALQASVEGIHGILRTQRERFKKHKQQKKERNTPTDNEKQERGNERRDPFCAFQPVLGNFTAGDWHWQHWCRNHTLKRSTVIFLFTATAEPLERPQGWVFFSNIPTSSASVERVCPLR